LRQIIARIQALLGWSSADGLERLLARLSGGAFILEVTGAVVAFLVQWLLARVLGAEKLGIYLFCLSWVRLLVLPAKLGMERASLRFISAYLAEGKLSLLRGFMTRAHQLVLGASLALGTVLFLITRTMGERLGDERLTAFSWAALALPLMALGGLQAAQLRGFRKITWALGSQKVLRPTLMIVLVLAALAFTETLSADRAMALQVGALALGLLASTTGLGLARPVELRSEAAEYTTRAWLAVSMPLLLITGFNVVLRQTDILMVGSILGPTQTGIYGVAVRVAALVHFGLTAVNAGLAPLISQLHAQGRNEELQGVVALGARLIFFFTLAVSLVVIFGTRQVLALFGAEFLEGTTALRVLIVSQLVNSLAGPVGLLMTMTGHQNQAARIIGGAAALNVVLNLALIPLFGIVGAAVATTVSMVVWNVLLVIAVRNKLGINPLVQWSGTRGR
jgi:O-antigen/teichoic acid export membrane protein